MDNNTSSATNLLLDKKKYTSINKLKSLSKKLMREWQNALHEYTISNITIKQLTSIEDEFEENIIYNISLGIPNAYVNIIISQDAAHSIISAFFGSSKISKKNSKITKLENLAIMKAVEVLADNIQETFSSILKKEINSQYKKIYKNEINTEIQFVFEVGSSQEKGPVKIIITEELSDLLEQQYHNIQKINTLDGIALNLRAILDRRKMTLADLKNISVGQIINFHSDNVEILADNIIICRGKIGCIGEERAIKVEKIMEVY